ncbi:hypothetical protein GLOIN_2v1791295 [Rhizophagus irregularis DAOM 181602=DAOM 197198]|nr:hypothetical protein GLOIN_2v1791295 [Rhizophagus irregularis DAOM 181602=DAOM 197198]
MDFNYISSVEAICSINMNILPLTNNHAMIIYIKLNNENANKFVEHSIVSYKGFISIEKSDKKGIVIILI